MGKPKAPAKPESAATLGRLGRFLKALRPDADERTIREIVGRRKVRTLAEVAHHFGVQPTTLRTSWRLQGMPGKPGEFWIDDIAVWRHKHEAEVAERQPGSTAKSQSVELRDIEIETARLSLRRKQRADALEDGEMVDRRQVRSEVSALIAVTREELLGLPDQLRPMLPVAHEQEVSEELTRLIRRCLIALGERSERDYMNAARRLEADDE